MSGASGCIGTIRSRRNRWSVRYSPDQRGVLQTYVSRILRRPAVRRPGRERQASLLLLGDRATE
jgi:hypothetical protein